MHPEGIEPSQATNQVEKVYKTSLITRSRVQNLIYAPSRIRTEDRSVMSRLL